MIVPVEWLKEYVDTNKSNKEIGKAFTLLGLMLDKPIENNILDLEHRMDRSDWLAIVGCARDFAAMEQLPLKFPALHTEQGKQIAPEDKIKIEVKCPDKVNRFNTRVFKNVQVQESPKWLKDRLESYGIPAKNNIVDITNYVMVELGQPMHAQNIDKMEKKEIVIRNAKENEQITTLLGENVTLDPSMFVLTQNDKATVIGGIVGGNTTGVTETTKNIVLDAGNYDQTNIRKTSRKLKIQNETVLRYDKFLHPHLTQVAIERATHLILQLAGGDYYFNEDYYPKQWQPKIMMLTRTRLNLISGLEFDLERAKSILISLEYKILDENSSKLTLEVPYFRTDIEVEDDLVADVLRIYSYENIPIAQLKATPPKEITPKLYRFEDTLRDILVAAGLHEHITTTLVKANNAKEEVVLENALNSEQNALRTNVFETLVKVINNYKKHGKSDIKLFEVGKIYTKEGRSNIHSSYVETSVTEIIVHSSKNPYEINKTLKQVVSRLLADLNLFDYVEFKDQKDVAEIYMNEELVGIVRFNSATFYNEVLLKYSNTTNKVISGFKNVISEDITIDVAVGKSAAEIYNGVNKLKEKFDILEKIEVINEFLKNDKVKAITFRAYFTAKQGNLTTQDVLKIKEKLISEL